MTENPDKEKLEKELIFKTTRSSGKGGQHVNKTETRVELYFDIAASQALNEEQKILLLEKLKNRVSGKGELMLASGQARSQLANKKLVTARFYDLLEQALKKRKRRKATRPSKASVEKRIKEKKKKAETKSQRKKPF